MNMADTNTQEPMFQTDGMEQSEVESLCMNCHEQGVTKFLLRKIPFFKDIIVSSFSCPHCGESNNETQSADPIQEKGVKINLKVNPSKDLNRRVVKTETTTIVIPELEFEIPPKSQKGVITTIEGILSRAVEGLQKEQPIRRAMDPDIAKKIDEFIEKLENLKERESFIFEMDDPAGNCFLENPHAPNEDPCMTMIKYVRTPDQNKALGLPEFDDSNVPEEVLQFDTNCPNCNAPVYTNMKMVDIPHFKRVILMALVCDACGERSNEIKSGTGFEKMGKRITLNVKDPSDLSRDVLKSETCTVKIPELDLEVGAQSISGKFTTVEGLLTDIKDTLVKKNPFTSGDSLDTDLVRKFQDFSVNMDRLKEGTTPFTLVLDDPVGNSYLQNMYAPEEDPEMKVEEYERTFEQNEELGLNDMKTEDY